MNTDDIFKLDGSLEDLSGIALAISLWEMPDVKSMINENDFSGASSFYYDPNEKSPKINMKNHKSSLSGQDIVNYVFKQLDMMKLPNKLLHQIKGLIVIIGQKISSWRGYVTKVLKLDSAFAEKILWTSYGHIDELKIFKDVWLVDSNFPGRQCTCSLGNYLFCLAARYGLEDIVETHYKEMKNLILPHLHPSQKELMTTPYAVMAAWILFCSNESSKSAVNRLSAILDYFPPGEPNKISAERLFYICCSNGFNFGAKYFWTKLNVNEKQNIIDTDAEALLSLWHFGWGKVYFADTEFRHDKFVKLFLFSFNDMTEIQKTEFIGQHFVDIFDLFSLVWPYQQLCEKILDQMWEHVPNQQIELLDKVFNNLIPTGEEKKPQNFTKKNFNIEILQLIMTKASKELKCSYFQRANYETVKILYQVFENQGLYVILNDPDLKNCRNRILNIGVEHFKNSVVKGKYKNLNLFLKDMKFCADQVKSFKLKFHSLLNIFLMNGNIKLAAKHLKWLCDSDRERIELKNQIDAFDVCYVLIQNNKFCKASEFLWWRFDEEKDFKSVKKALISNEFLINRIFEIWGSLLDLKLIILKCSELLKWFFESEEKVVEFKENVLLQDGYLVERFWNSAFVEKSLTNFDEFLKFCLLTPEEIAEMKVKMANDISSWIDFFSLERGNFELTNALLSRVYAPRDEKIKEAFENYMNTPHGSLLCIKIFKNSRERSPLPIIDFFNTWVTPFSKFFDMKMHLAKFIRHNYVFERDYRLMTCIKFLFRVREKNELVTARDLILGDIKFQSFNLDQYDYYDDRDLYGDEEESDEEDSEWEDEEEAEDEDDETEV